MKKLLLGSVALLAFSAGTAGAADLGTRPIPKALPMAPAPVAFSWSGCYIGGHAGGAWESKSFRAPTAGTILPPNGFTTEAGVFFSSFTAPVSTSVAAANFNANGALINTGVFDQHLSGPIAGGQIGCNLQFAGGWVIGVEGDASWAGLSGSKTGSFSASSTGAVNHVPFFHGTAGGGGAITTTFGTSTGTVTTSGFGMLHVKTDFLATITGRLGYSWDRLLFYGKGGVAFAHDKYRLASATTVNLTTTAGCFGGGCTATNAQVFDFSASQDRVGWTAGVGLEYAIAPNWSIKAEWNYMDFGTKTVRFTDAFGAGAFDVSVRERVNAVKVGVNYLFNFGKGAPVVARY